MGEGADELVFLLRFPAQPVVNVHIGTFVNNDAASDVRSLSDEIGRDTIRQLRMQGVMA